MKISINTPCHQPWENMQPNATGAFCLSCQKNVVDFTGQSLAQIKAFFAQKPPAQSLCGRFRESQLEALTFDDFFARYRQWHYFQKAALIAFFVFGSSLFAGAQTRSSVGTGTATTQPLATDSSKTVPHKNTGHDAYILGKLKVQPTPPAKKEPERIRMGAPEQR